ncbi:MAG TPA: imidazolonepropionase [Phycisphaerales bacterium]|nr:imidazolonepropionase [Phycisphaerales bacterium]
MTTGLLIRGARVVTMGPPGERRGRALGELGVLERADVLVRHDRIVAVTSARAAEEVGTRAAPPGPRVVEAAGRVLVPGLVDCHTHACWAGQRLDEWEAGLRGQAAGTEGGYLRTLAGGGGILSTVRAVREASADELRDSLLARLDVMLRHGTTTAEVKSGYGLSTTDELKMLRAIAAAASRWPGTLVPTALLGHAIDPELGPGETVRRTVEQTLPAVSAEFPGIAIDAYCERAAWSVGDCVRLFERARELGHPVRVHADQFTELGMVAEAVRLGARSVDHLEASGPASLLALAGSETTAVLLPCAAFHLEGRSADGRTLLDAGARVAVATNYNPGSAPCPSLPMAMALAVRRCGLSPGEALGTATVGAAGVLGLADRGRIAPGLRADLVLLRHTDERALAWEFGASPVDLTIAGGRIVG